VRIYEAYSMALTVLLTAISNHGGDRLVVSVSRVGGRHRGNTGAVFSFRRCAGLPARNRYVGKRTYQIGSIPIHGVEMKRKHFQREVRRVRHLSAWIKVEGRAHCECQVMDISKQGAKVIVEPLSAVPNRFALVFFQGDQTRVCEVIWRRDKILGVKFI
jgi:hypothetical protein